jgi:alpha-amylase
MCTKFFSDGDVHMYFNPYDNPYNAFINYMNVLSDFIKRVENAAITAFGDDEPTTKEEIRKVIKKYQKEIDRLQRKLEKFEGKKKPVRTTKTTKTTRKTSVKKSNNPKSKK